MKSWIALLCTLLLTACIGGGGGSDTTPTVTDIQARNLGYGRQAEFDFTGRYLDRGLTVTVPNCTSQTPVYTSPTQQVLACVLTAAGDLTVLVQNGAGQVVFTKTFTIPQPQVILSTSKGDITVELDPAKAPHSVDNFLRHVQSGFYIGTIFHRVIGNFVVQGGGFMQDTTPKTPPYDPIPLESNNGLSNLRGTLAMARTADPNSATSQFYINLVNNTSLDYRSAESPGYAVFGKVVKGMDAVDAIGSVATTTKNGMPDVPVDEIYLKIALRVQ